MRNLIRVFLAAVALAAFPTAAGANLITNGSFEDPDIATGTFAVYASIAGWSSSTAGGGIEIQDHVAGSPFLGQQHVELDSYTNSDMMSASLSTSAFTAYLLSFAYSPRPGISAASNPVEVYFNGFLLDTVTGDGTTLSDTSWVVHSYLVVATSASSDVTFVATGIDDALGGYLDDVRFTVVPEPAALSLLALGLIAFGFSQRRS